MTIWRDGYSGVGGVRRLALEKGYAEAASKGRHKLTHAGLEALVSDAEQRMEMRAANRLRGC
jgi:hypothetical protein